ncbi:MAG TPA: GlsB/YeaQ/YmgE family stress response membrane protein [Allosphingosinicella sp.]|jgi:uncharacterized membrane protein YeaQ/YmgE (transglycosylase-associated protein family)
MRKRREAELHHLLAYHGIIAWIIIGGLAGIIAKAITPGRDPQGCIVTVLLGIAGAVVAGWLGHRLGWYHGSQGAGFLAAIVGAVIILFVYRAIAGRRF